MPIVFQYECPNCGAKLPWIYDEEEDSLRTDSVTGCPGTQCTKIHEVKVQRVDEAEAAEIEERSGIN